MHSQYLFTSQRLGFRKWHTTDISMLAAINRDTDVMEFFPEISNEQQTRDFVQRMETLMAAKGYCYFAVDLLSNGRFIGFIGLAEKTFAAAFTPCIDIGWRIDKAYWNKGYATEGAQRCLQYGFETLQLDRIVAMAPAINTKSIRIMEKIGMSEATTFQHPQLSDCPRLQTCVLYETTRTKYK